MAWNIISRLPGGSVESLTCLHRVQGKLSTHDRRSHCSRLRDADDTPITGRISRTPKNWPQWTGTGDPGGEPMVWAERRFYARRTNPWGEVPQGAISPIQSNKTIKQNRKNTTVFHIAAVAPDAQPGMVSPTLALLSVMTQTWPSAMKRNQGKPTERGPNYYTSHWI